MQVFGYVYIVIIFLPWNITIGMGNWGGGTAELADKPASELLEVKCQYALVFNKRLQV
jgi:hypothetical protein